MTATRAWTGALRTGTHTVTTCGHRHRTRDLGPGSARDCITALARAAHGDPTAAAVTRATTTRLAVNAQKFGAHVNPEAVVAEYEQRLDAIRATRAAAVRLEGVPA